jgi:hypothetical protein
MGYLIVLANDIIALVGLAASFSRPEEPLHGLESLGKL